MTEEVLVGYRIQIRPKYDTYLRFVDNPDTIKHNASIELDKLCIDETEMVNAVRDYFAEVRKL